MATSLLSSLPAPQKQYTGPVAPAAPARPEQTFKDIPPYPKRQNAGFVPRRPEDFAGGGAFPEIHVAQYPLDMGRPDAARNNTRTLAVSVNAEGQVTHDALLKRGSNRDKIIASDHKALVPKIDRITNEALQKPDEEEVEATVSDTKAALEKLVNNKLSAVNPATLPAQPGGPQYIKYTPSQQGPAYNSGANHRIIKMQDMPVDPLEPPKFRHVKVPRGPGSPPVPVMHSPPRPLTQEDQANWKIPPCISNWKNPKGYTIPLDKRLAADGRGLQQSVVNDKFAGLAEALFTAEETARRAIAARAAVQKELLAQEKAKKEAELRELAMKARLERAGGVASRLDTGTALPPPPPLGGGGGGGGGGAAPMEEDDDELPPPPPRPGYEESAQEREERRRRDEIREERRRERERERRLESKEAHGSKKSKITRDRDRDVSEKVALGMARVNGGEVQYDQRLFNQEQGMASGFGADDSYGVYDKPLFVDRSAAGGLHRPKAAADDEDEGAGGGIRTDKFKADRGFKGTEGEGGGRGGGRTGGPVEFERTTAAPAADEADPFGLDAFLTDVKKGGKSGRGNALDAIGTSGGMRAAGGGSSLDDQLAGGSGRRMQFTSGRG